METLFIYLLKASALLAVYFLAYHFLLRKETFFTTNRWFLLAGMITSGVMPLLFIEKIVKVEKPKVSVDDFVQYDSNSSVPVQEAAKIDWFQVTAFGYAIIAAFLFIKILTHLVSLFKLLHKKEVVKKERFSLVDLNEDIAPFSFFNYIVYNSTYYTQDELNSILLHEKIHSQERHSLDVLLAKLFCIVFWFNPFMWLYKKAITQNLEYIADQKAVLHIEDKKVYQRALLKVVSHQNCLSLTNNFYQSLIKKRIVMLNKNQSKKSNSWKYALVLPVLVAFVIFFQVKVIAQEKLPMIPNGPSAPSSSQQVTEMVWTKDSSDDELKKDIDYLKKEGVKIKYSKLKRNNNGEITGIKVEFKDQSGKTGITHVSGDDPIKPIYFQKSKDYVGFGRSNRIERDTDFSFSFNDGDEIADIEALEAPEAPEMIMDIEVPEAPEAPEAPGAPELPRGTKDMNKRIIIKKGHGDKPVIIINGEKVDNDEMLLNLNKELEHLNHLQIFSDDDDEVAVPGNDKKRRVKIISKEEIEKITEDAMKNARIEIERARPQMERARKEMKREKREIDLSGPEMQKAREEMQKAKIEMEKAREEMLKAKEEMLKAKSELKTKKA